MAFDRNNYLEWYLPRIHRDDAALNLHASGVAWIDAEVKGARASVGHLVGELFEEALAKQLRVARDEIVYTPGATGGTLLALLTLAGADDSVVVEAPIYEPMLRQAERVSEVVRFERRFDEGWRLPVERAASLIDNGTALVLITEPHNPSGVLSPRQSVLELADLAAGHGALLLINEVYSGFGDAPSYHGARANIVVVSSLSKLLGAYGARLGWLGAAPDRIRKLRAAHFNYGMGSAPGAVAGLSLLDDYETRRARSAALAREGLPTVAAWVESRTDVSWIRPDGPGFGCVKLPHGLDDVAFAEYLHDRRGVLTVPGTAFGLPGFLRLSWLQAGDRLSEGLAIVGEALVESRS